MEIIEVMSNLNVSYLILGIFCFICSLLFLFKRNTSDLLLKFFLIVYSIIFFGSLYYFNDTLNEIFQLQYLNIKLYLVLIVIGNIIMIVTINTEQKGAYKILNYGMFLVNVAILVINLLILITNHFELLYIADNQDIIVLMDMNMIIFVWYLILMCFIHIALQIRDSLKITKKRKLLDKDNFVQEEVMKEEIAEEISISDKKRFDDARSNLQEGFYIDGIDCSIIFDNNNEEEIVQNYYILLNDVNAKLVNGYTLWENMKLKTIFDKLNVKDVNHIVLDVNKLSKITMDEYDLLKRYIGSKN